MIYYYLIALVIIVIDQFTKWLVVQNLDLREVVEIIPGFLNITSHRNSGAAWGVLEGKMWFFYLITLVVIGVLIYFMQRYAKNSKLLGVSLALVLGGAIGNFIDRLLHQEVVDFVQTIWGNYYFPIFNVADASLTIGVILLIVYVFLDDRKSKGTKKMTQNIVIIPEKLNHERLDKGLAELLGMTRSGIQTLLKDDAILVNGEKTKANYKCKTGDEITYIVREPEELDILAEDIPLDIYYEDKDVLVVNKPQGMVVHPSAGHTSGTLVNALLFHCDDLSGINGKIRPGIVHRIDKDTSGLLMVAKNDKAHESLAEQLYDKTSDREYIALVHGVIKHQKGTIDAPIGRSKEDRQKMGIVNDGKESRTHFEVLERFKGYTLIKCRLETGRTHQIRVHMKYIGHPLAGDPKYGLKNTIKGEGQFLHASELGFTHPTTQERMKFEAPLPANFQEALENLRE